PALLLRAPDIIQFDPQNKIGATQFGVLSLPRLARTEIKILDGQHRILGLNYAIEDLAGELEEKRSLLSSAKRQENPELERDYRQRIIELEALRQRLHDEAIAIQILIEDDVRQGEQMFVDIADNALGITSAIRARFDDRKVVNRCLDEVLNHALLKGRVDMEQDRIGPQSPYLLGAKHVTDVIRALEVGLGGRIGRRLEAELNEAALVEQTNDFLDVLLGSFPDLAAVADGQLTPQDLRRRSLLGSTTMLRILAAAYRTLAEEYSDQDIEERLGALAPKMVVPIREGSPWLATQSFAVGAAAPQARNQNMVAVANQVVAWARQAPD
ncbi:MAG: DNA sulfur modification protein DndB, partial [Candidatus Dormiibacterota bacterium]